MIYLSRFVLNPRSRQVQAELRSPYELHRTLAKAFGDGEGELAAARLLFRVDELPGGGLHLLAQACTAPNWQGLTVADDYWLGAPEVKAIDPTLAVGQRLAFRLRANPTVKRDGKRIPLREEHEQTAWLRRKGEAHGFTLVSVRLRQATASRSRTADGWVATLEGVTFDGLLRVTDPEALLAALAAGIGSAKGFGFGLLSLARG